MKNHKSYTDVTDILASKIIKNGDRKQDRKVLDWLDENGISVFITEKGNYFFYQDRSTSFPKGADNIPEYVRDGVSCIEKVDKIRIFADPLLKVKYSDTGERDFMTAYSYQDVCSRIANGENLAFVEKLGYASKDDSANIIDKVLGDLRPKQIERE